MIRIGQVELLSKNAQNLIARHLRTTEKVYPPGYFESTRPNRWFVFYTEPDGSTYHTFTSWGNRPDTHKRTDAEYAVLVCQNMYYWNRAPLPSKDDGRWRDTSHYTAVDLSTHKEQ